MSSALSGFIFCANKNLDYGQRLVADLSQEQMTQQPAPDGSAPSNHPAWVLSHLNVYMPLLSLALEGKTFDDPKDHRFGMQSQPLDDPTVYDSKEKLIGDYVAYHETVIRQLESADASVLETPIELARWKPVMPTVGVCLPYLLCNHENLHLGQISAWRRIQGLPSV
jgi:hypothetical protein